MAPELAHTLTLRALKTLRKTNFGNQILGESAKVAGLRFPNRVGLAAGFDKNGEAIVGSSRLGFGFVEIGAVTPLAQPGNSKPRLFRSVTDEAVINRMGFNNDGVDQMHHRLSITPSISPVQLGINLGVNKSTPIDRIADDYLTCMRSLADYADYFTINISSPNTKGLREFVETDHVEATLSAITSLRNELIVDTSKPLPIFVKISPDLEIGSIRDLAAIVVASGCDGIVATNTTTDRIGVEGSFARHQGGLSGRPLLARSLHVVETVRDAVGKDFALIGVGGISSGEDAIAMRQAGADLIQLYTALVFQGPGLVSKLVSACN